MRLRTYVLTALWAAFLGGAAHAQPHPAAEPTSTARTRQVRVTPQSVVSVRAHLLLDTLLVLPAGERIMEIHCGNPEFWQVRVAAIDHMASVKPSKVGASGNVHIMTASGNVYSFDLTEVSAQPAVTPDEKIFVQGDDAMDQTLGSSPKWVPASDVARFQERATAAAAEAQSRVDRALSTYPTSLRFGYRFDRNKRPFWIDQIWHDDQRTYLRAHAKERAALYEMLDGKPSLTQFELTDGDLYIVPKVLDAGYLTIGDQRTDFRREQE
jgi:type IV secretory pathway VirB9-like protein